MPAHPASSRALAPRAALARLTCAVLIVSCAAVLPLRAQTFHLSYHAGTHAGPITGRAYLFVARADKEEPRLQSGASGEIGRDTSELQSPCNLVCRLLLEKKKQSPYAIRK